MITSSGLMKQTGLTFRQVDHWCRQGYLKPLNREVESQGFRREFPSSELRVALMMRDLMACGFSVAAAAKLARGDKELIMKIDLTLSAVRFGTS